MTEMEYAEILVGLSSEVSRASVLYAQSIERATQAMQCMAAVNQRIEEVVHGLLANPGLAENPSFGENGTGRVASDRVSTETAASPDGPQTHGGRRTVTASPGGDAGVGSGSDAQAAGTAGRAAKEPPQSEQAAEAAPGVVPGAASPPARAERPSIYDAVLDRFAETGHDHSTLAEFFKERVAVISRCLSLARQTKDNRAARGDLKRHEAIQDDAEQGRAEHRKPTPRKPAGNSPPTIEPDPDDVGNPIAEVVFTDGLARRLDTHQDTRMAGPALRVIALLKDQQFHDVEEVWKRAGRYTSEVVLRSNLTDIQRSLSRIGLHIFEDERGFQLRRLVDKESSAA